MDKEVAIIGVGMVSGGEHWGKSLRQMFVEAALEALEDAGIQQIDGMFVGCMSGGLFAGQEHLASLLPDYLGMDHVPATRVESACASGGLALRTGWMSILSGQHEMVLVGGVEKMTDVSGSAATYALSTAADQTYEGFHGITFPGLYAMTAREHMERYGTTRKQLAEVAVKNHANGALNDKAQFRRPISVEDVMNSLLVADPLRVLDCSPITDGASAAILCPLDVAKKISRKPPVKISGSGHATDRIALHSRKDILAFDAVAKSAQQAYKAAGKTPGQIDVVEVHDCFTIAELLVLEAMGLLEKGHSGPAVEAGYTALDGKLPVNTSGGLKAKGHPVGATGISQAIEVVQQLRGEAGDRQVTNAKVGLIQNMGGSGGSSVVHILEAL